MFLNESYLKTYKRAVRRKLSVQSHTFSFGSMSTETSSPDENIFLCRDPANPAIANPLYDYGLDYGLYDYNLDQPGPTLPLGPYQGSPSPTYQTEFETGAGFAVSAGINPTMEGSSSGTGGKGGRHADLILNLAKPSSTI